MAIPRFAVGDRVQRVPFDALYAREGPFYFRACYAPSGGDVMDYEFNIYGKTPCPVQDVYNARRRLKTHVEAIEKLMEGW